MKVIKACVATVVLLAGAMAAEAGSFQIGPRIGTLGGGAEAAIGVVSSLWVRVGYNAMSCYANVTSDDVDGTLKFDFQTVPLFIDWHPFKTDFRITVGMVRNNNEIRVWAIPNESVTVSDVEYYVERFDGLITFDKWSRYVGIGADNPIGKSRRVVISWDLGVLLHGKPQLSATAVAIDPILQPFLDADLAEEVADAQSDANKYRIYPVIAFGINVAF